MSTKTALKRYSTIPHIEGSINKIKKVLKSLKFMIRWLTLMEMIRVKKWVWVDHKIITVRQMREEGL